MMNSKNKFLILFTLNLFNTVTMLTFQKLSENIDFRLYIGPITSFIDIKLLQSHDLLTNVNFNLNNPTVFYIHGYTENTTSESVQSIVKAYLQYQPNTNMILINWSYLSGGDYIFNALHNTRKASILIAIEIKKLTTLGLNLQNTHFIGFSLGAHVAGFIGKELQKDGMKLRRITALDPAFPGFYPSVVFGHVTKNDAEFVDVIHTDGGLYGAPVSTGTIDFWPNGGSGIQSGCPMSLKLLSLESYCSHQRSWKYYVESVSNNLAFPAIKDWSYIKFKKHNSVPNLGKPFVYMGINVNMKETGNYFLITNAAAPFGKGIDGTYVKSENKND